MEFKVTRRLNLREEPRSGSGSLGKVGFDDVIEILGEEGEWSRVRVIDLRGNTREGFLKTVRLVEREPDAPVSEDIDEQKFILVLTFAARQLGVNRDYLAALAWVKSRIKNRVDAATGAIGPFQFQRPAWKALVGRHGDREQISERDIINFPSQAIFAAVLAKEATDRLLNDTGTLPSSAELFLAHILGLEEASALLARGVDRTQPIDAQLLELFRDRPDRDEFVAKKIEGNKRFLMSESGVRSTEEALEAAAVELDNGLREAARIVALLPEADRDVPSVAGDAGAPWMAIARQELARGVTEIKGPSGSEPRIEEYHASTTLRPPFTDDDSWCGSFVSFCMENCGNPFVVAENKRSGKTARAANWDKWGNRSVTEPPIGAVVVLHPLAPGSSGHVGFLTGMDDTHIRLLAGNQTDATGNQSVCEVRFRKLKVRVYRWLDIPRTGPGTPTTGVDEGNRVKEAFEHFLADGFTAAQAAGIVGNFMQESTEKLDPTIENVGEGAIGIAQWREAVGRRPLLRSFAAAQGKAETDFRAQLDFASHELRGSHARAARAIKATTTVKNAAIEVRDKYEVAVPAHDDKRIAFAQRVFNEFAGDG